MKHGWYREGSNYVLYSDGKEVKRQTTDPKTSQAKKPESSKSMPKKVPEGIWAYPGDKSYFGNGTDDNKSRYSTKDWQEYADYVAKEVDHEKFKNNKEFQKFLYDYNGDNKNIKPISDKVRALHSTDPGGYEMPKSGTPYDDYIGHRWDWILDEKPKKSTPSIVDNKKGDINTTPLKTEAPANYTHQKANAPWWMQDVINTAAAAGTRLGLKKTLPWAPQVELQTPRATFFDPTRELANNNEQYAVGTEGAAMFAGPQAYNSRESGLQGNAAKTAANILSNYHNKNVGVANQFENMRTAIYNQNSQMNAGIATKLYDETTLANQNFDNAKRQANNELRSTYVNAITNRAKTQALNTLYPHYQVDPSTGGTADFWKGSDPKAYDPNEDAAFNNYMKAITQYTDSEDKKYAAYWFKPKDRNVYDPNEVNTEGKAAYDAQYKKYGGFFR